MKKEAIFFLVVGGIFLSGFALAQGVDLPRTGQTTLYATGDDGDLERGVVWPSPRWTGYTGTVTDNLTGLMWTKNANLGGIMTWQNALNYVAGMNTGANPNYGYTDWRLPNINELESLIDAEKYNPALPSGHPFTGVASGYYWSSSSYAPNTGLAWVVYVHNGGLFAGNKSDSYYVWPVRAGQ